jgi:hypothetical protein
VLFYSQYSQYCDDVVRFVTKKGLKHMFVLVCIDTNLNQVPQFVDRVPAILTKDRRLLTDEQVMSFVTSSLDSCDPVGSACGNGAFSFVGDEDGTDTEGAGGGWMAWSSEGGDDAFPSSARIYCVEETGAGARGGAGAGAGAGAGDDVFKSLETSRQQELSAIWGKQPRGNDMGPPPPVYDLKDARH